MNIFDVACVFSVPNVTLNKFEIRLEVIQVMYVMFVLLDQGHQVLKWILCFWCHMCFWMNASSVMFVFSVFCVPEVIQVLHVSYVLFKYTSYDLCVFCAMRAFEENNDKLGLKWPKCFVSLLCFWMNSTNKVPLCYLCPMCFWTNTTCVMFVFSVLFKVESFCSNCTFW